MSFLGELNQSEAIRFFLTLDTAPTGTPTVTIEKNGASILAAQSMIQGNSTLEWYYDYTTAADATIGTYQARFTAVVDGVTRYAYDHYNISVYSVDDNNLLLSAIGGTGAYNATINVKDQIPVNIADAFVTIHNASDNDLPVIAYGTTDNSGNVTLNIEGNVYIRVKKSGFDFTSTAKNITASGTYNVTGTSNVVSNPSDPDLCRLRIFPITLHDQDITDLKIYINSYQKFTKVDGQFIGNRRLEFTYDSTTDPDSYYFDAIQGVDVTIRCDELGIDKVTILVPSEASKDLDDLIS